MTAAAIESGDSPAVARARQLLSENRSLTMDEQSGARGDMERAGRGTMEWGILRAIYGEIDKRGADRIRDETIQRNIKDIQARGAHRARRPERWAALPHEARVLLLVADEQGASSSIGRVLVRMAALMNVDTSKLSPPESTFEPEKW